MGLATKLELGGAKAVGCLGIGAGHCGGWSMVVKPIAGAAEATDGALLFVPQD